MARDRNKLTITATQMMESMIHNRCPRALRCRDVANAVLDGTDAVMLSAETAAGSTRSETVETMAQIVHRGGEVGRGRARLRVPQPHVHARRPVDRHTATLFTAFHLGARRSRADRLRLDGAVDVAAQHAACPIFALTPKIAIRSGRWRCTATSARCILEQSTDRDEVAMQPPRLLARQGPGQARRSDRADDRRADGQVRAAPTR